MARNKAVTVDQYLNNLPQDRRAIIEELRDLILRNLPQGYREAMNWGAITYEVPLERLPDTYNGQPLCYIALAAQKNYCSLYLMTVYGNAKQAAWFKQEFKKAGKKLDMGKSCVRFRTLEDLPLSVIAQVVASTPMDKYIAWYQASRTSRKR